MRHTADAPAGRGAATMVLRGQDAWRRHPIFRWKLADMFPGLREGAALFATYVVVDYAWGKLGPTKDAHGHGHGDAAHAGSGELAARPH